MGWNAVRIIVSKINFRQPECEHDATLVSSKIGRRIPPVCVSWTSGGDSSSNFATNQSTVTYLSHPWAIRF